MKKLLFLFNIFLSMTLISCAQMPVRTQRGVHTIEPYPTTPRPQEVTTVPDIIRGDIYHEVGPGETVWRISKMYDVGMEDIVQANNLWDATCLEKGQRLFIPEAAPMRYVIPLYKSNKWKYIIIHHSATDIGNALRFDAAHKRRRWKGLGYHFVIDNGTSGKEDGQIEVSPRWIHQENGAHCKANHMNSRGIGVCLVGNFSEDRISESQMDSLAYLVNHLKEYYNIPNYRILGHGQVKGASTECPGLKFPWEDFRRRLKP